MSPKRIAEPDHFPWLDYRRYTFSLGVEKAGVVFLSGETASEYDAASDRVVCHGNVVEQMRLAYEKLRLSLESLGGGFDDVVKTVDYVAPAGLAEYRGTADVRREHFKGRWPASTGIVVERLLRSDALIEVDAVAVLGHEKKPVDPGWPRYQRLTYAPGVRAGDLLCVSGFTGAIEDADGQRRYPDSPSEQTAAAHGFIGQVLHAAGAGPGDVGKSLDYITPACLEGYAAAGEARHQFPKDRLPASTGVAINRLLHPDALIEVEATAVLGAPCQEIEVPGWLAPDGPPAPAAVRQGRFLFISGQTAVDHRTGAVVGEGDVLAQTTQVYSNLKAVLEAAGGSMADVVKTTELITPPGLRGYRGVGDIRRRFFGDEFPAATGVVVSSLLRPELLIQVDATAILD